MNSSMNVRALAALALTASVVGCSPSAPQQEPLPPAPRVVSFTVSAAEVRSGESVTLSWETKDGATVELEESFKGVPSGFEGQLAGSLEVAITEDSLFVLTVANSRGIRDSVAVSVRVKEGPKNVVFIGSPGVISAGESSILAWTASGAQEVSLRVKDGDPIDLGGQLESGSVDVSPIETTVYVLRVDGEEFEAQVEVRPTISAFQANAKGVAPGEMVTLSWQTAGASKVSISRSGFGEVHSVTEPTQLADGSFSEAVPATVDGALVFTYVLRAEGVAAESFSTEQVTVYVAGAPEILDAQFPLYAATGGTFEVSWETVNATAVEILEGGVVIYRSPDLATTNEGTVTLSSPTVTTEYRLRAVDGRGGVALSEPFSVDPVGVPTVNAFTATPQPGIASGGDPVTLTWDVPNARNLKIVAQTQYDVTVLTGKAAETGSITAYPNKDTTYELIADNGIGDAIQPVTADVTVTTPAKLIFSPATAPLGATVAVTGSTVPNGGDVLGLPTIAHNAVGEAFVDIRTTGVDIDYSGPDTSAKVVTLPEVFSTRIFGQQVQSSSLNISINGWFAFQSSYFSGPDTPSPFPTTSLVPLAIAPFWADLYDNWSGQGEIYYQLDTVGTDRRLIVQWDQVEYDPSAGSEVTIQAQVYSSGKIVFAYKTLQGASGANVSIGVVNDTETDALATTLFPAEGDTFTLFGKSTLPVNIKASATPFTCRQLIGTGPAFIEIESTYPVIPPGQFVVSEVNVNPAVAGGQWVELQSQTANPIDLDGWTLDFGATTHTVSGSLVLQPGGRLVLAQSANAADGVTVDYVYGTTATIVAGTPVGVTIAGGTYTSLQVPAASFPSGYSWQSGAIPVVAGLLRASGATSMQCLAAATATYGTNGQRGTPGAANSNCPTTVYAGPITSSFESISLTGTLIPHNDSDASVEPITPAAPLLIDGIGYPTVYVGSNGWITTDAVTCSGYPCFDTNQTTPAAPRGFIAGYWDDLDLGSGGVYWQRKVPGISPNDGYTIVSWENVQRYYQFSDSLNFQVKFFDTGTIEIHFGTMTGGNGSGATTWWGHPSGLAAWRVNTNSSTSPGIQSNTAFRFTAL